MYSYLSINFYLCYHITKSTFKCYLAEVLTHSIFSIILISGCLDAKPYIIIISCNICQLFTNHQETLTVLKSYCFPSVLLWSKSKRKETKISFDKSTYSFLPTLSAQLSFFVNDKIFCWKFVSHLNLYFYTFLLLTTYYSSSCIFLFLFFFLIDVLNTEPTKSKPKYKCWYCRNAY